MVRTVDNDELHAEWLPTAERDVRLAIAIIRPLADEEPGPEALLTREQALDLAQWLVQQLGDSSELAADT